MNQAPFDILKYFGIDDDDELRVIEVAWGGEWFPVKPFFPDATLLVVLYMNRGVRKIAVKCEERITEFDLMRVIARDGELVGVDR